MEENHMRIQRTVRYYQTGESSAEGELLMALHGYSQHPKFFLRKIESLAGPNRIIVAPEGLHRMYVNGNSGRVGSSWMTKEDRLNDIEDYCLYLWQLAELPNFKQPKQKTLLGFSQGASAAIRLFCAYPLLFSKLILWAGAVPPDLSLPENKSVLNAVGIDLVIGDQDEFIKESDVLEIRDVLDKEGIHYRLHRFEGKHDLDVKILRQIL
ncbi:MAG: putative esterase [Flavobacteriales bacterium]|jgi:predicted esterase